jgi:hypothetical protein
VVNKILSTLAFPVEKNKTHSACHGCQMAKTHDLPFRSSTFVSSKPLDLIFTDVWGLHQCSPYLVLNIMLAFLMIIPSFSSYFLLN